MANLICSLLSLFLIVVFGRVILSWFPISPGSAMASVYRFLLQVTEPVLGPLRRVIPPLGAFDLSPLILILIVRVLQAQICGARGGLF